MNGANYKVCFYLISFSMNPSRFCPRLNSRFQTTQKVSERSAHNRDIVVVDIVLNSFAVNDIVFLVACTQLYSLQPSMSVGRMVGQSYLFFFFAFMAIFRIAAPAQMLG